MITIPREDLLRAALKLFIENLVLLAVLAGMDVKTELALALNGVFSSGLTLIYLFYRPKSKAVRLSR